MAPSLPACSAQKPSLGVVGLLSIVLLYANPTPLPLILSWLTLWV